MCSGDALGSRPAERVYGVTLADIQLLYAYNAWASAHLLASASLLPGELLDKDLGASYSSLFKTLRHIAWGEWLWLARWQERMATDRSPQDCEDITTLRWRWSEIQREQTKFIAQLVPSALERLVSYENPPGTRWTYSLRHMLQHVVNHSTYHRGQIASMLRQVGATPPATDFLLYLDERAVPA